MLCLPKRIDYKYRLLSGTLAAQFITHLMVLQPHQQFVWNQASVSFMLWTVTETCSIKNASEEWQHNLFLSSKRPPHSLSIQSTGMVKIEREMGTWSARELMKLVFLQKYQRKSQVTLGLQIWCSFKLFISRVKNLLYISSWDMVHVGTHLQPLESTDVTLETAPWPDWSGYPPSKTGNGGTRCLSVSRCKSTFLFDKVNLMGF